MLLEFINENPDWQDILTRPPYSIVIKNFKEYYLLKYSQFDSDFSYQLVQEARGCIIKKFSDSYKYVCRPFDKFFNIQEPFATKLDLTNGISTQEKVDGSIMKLWYDHGWHVSTNTSIDAYNSIVGDSNLTFGQLFDKAFEGNFKAMLFNSHFFNTHYTYIFELVSPESQVIIYYPKTKLYLIGIRDNNSGKELDPEFYYECHMALREAGILLPKRYPLNTIEQCLAAVEKMDATEEGFVVVDSNYQRVKIKSLGWLQAHHAANNGVLTAESVLEMYFKDELDDFLVLCPQYSERVNKYLNSYFALVEDYKAAWAAVENDKNLSRKDFAKKYSSSTYAPFFFKKLSNLELQPDEYFRDQSAAKICKNVKFKNILDLTK